MQKFSDTVTANINSAVVVLSGASVTVYQTGSTTLATIYSDNGTTPKANPFTTGSTGLIEFYAADGRYDLLIAKTGYTTVTKADILLEDPNDQQNDNIFGVSISGCTIESSAIGSATPALGGFTGVQLSTASPAASAVGRTIWNATAGTSSIGLIGGNVTLNNGQQELIRVRNNTGSPLAKGAAVYVNGSSGTHTTVALAQANAEVSSSRTFGIVAEAISNNTEGFISTFGVVENIDTSALTEGHSVYLSPSVAGGLTSTKPSAPNHMVLIGFCVRSNPTNGVLFVKVANGFEMEELHNVAISAVATDDVIQYDGATSLWKNNKVRISSSAPASATSTGVAGTIAFDSGYIYICTATDTWQRVAVASW